MYAMTGKMTAQLGKRDEFVEILLEASDFVSTLPECLMYIVNVDISNETDIWVYEVWMDKESHDLSLKDEQAKALISKAMPLLAKSPDGVEMRVISGHGVS